MEFGGLGLQFGVEGLVCRVQGLGSNLASGWSKLAGGRARKHSYTLHPTPYNTSTPYTPTPYTLHPPLFSLHPIPYTLKPEHCTLLPYTLQPAPCTLHPTSRAWTPPAPLHAGLFVGVSQKSILNRVCQLLAINANKMAPRTSQGLQEPAWDTPT